MKKLALVLVLFLSACVEPTPEEKENLDKALPEGCAVVYDDRWGSIQQMVVITCDGKTVTSINAKTPQGKTSYTHAVVVIE